MKHIFRNTIGLAVIGILAAAFQSCEKHDFFDEQLITGMVGPQAYWEIGSATVGAGKNVSFEIQYYSTESEIDRSEVWYNVSETESKQVSCPWVSTFSYTISSTNIEEKRISQKFETYPHSLAVWSDSLRAYTFKGTFPVSGTLKPINWVKPAEYSATNMNKYFGKDFMQHFKDSLYTKMKYADFRKMMLGMGLVEDFKQYTDSTFDTNSNSFVYHFPKDAAGDTPVPADLKTLYEGITFDQLIHNTADNNYAVEYKKNFFINAVMRVYDTRGVYGTTILKKIDIN